VGIPSGSVRIGRWTYDYALIPHEAGWENAFSEAHRFARPLRTGRIPSGSGEWPREKSLLSISKPEVVLSTVKLAEDGDAVIARDVANALGVSSVIRDLDPELERIF